jgi:uncharacterized membrane protein YbhN (UPF0104 family)
MRTKIKILLWGCILSATIAGAVTAIGHFSGGYGRFAALASTIGFTQWLVLALATVVFYLLDYCRLYTLFALQGIRIGAATGLRLTCVSYLVSSLTPTAELNIPALVFMLRSRGVAVPKAIAVLLVKAIYITFWLCIFGFAGLLLRSDVHLPPALAEHLVVLVAPALLLLAAFFYVVFFPQRALRWTAARMSGEPPLGWTGIFIAGLHRTVRAVSELGRSTGRLHWLSHLSCIAFVCTYIFIGAYLCRALGVPMPAGKALCIFSVSLLVAYISPVPGSIGVCEVLTSYFIDPAMTQSGMVASCLLRLLCSYLLMIPGAVILLDAIRAAGWRQLQQKWQEAS